MPPPSLTIPTGGEGGRGGKRDWDRDRDKTRETERGGEKQEEKIQARKFTFYKTTCLVKEN